MKSILKNTNFVLLWTAQVLEQFGDSLVILSLISWAMGLHEKGTAAGNISLLMLWIAVPIVLVGPVAGVFVDRLKKKTMLASAAAIRGICILIISMLIYDRSNGASVYLMVFLISAVSQFFGSAKSAFIPQLVRSDELIDANSMTAASVITAQIFTYAIGGVMIAGMGNQKIIFAAACVYFAVAAVILFIKSDERPAGQKRDRKGNELWREFFTGLKFLFTEKDIFFMVRSVFILVVGAGLIYVSLTGNFLAIIIASTGMKTAGIKALGFMQAFLGFGLVAGMFFVSNAVKWIREKDLVRLVFPLLGAAVVMLYFFRDYYFLLFIAVAAGMAGVIVISLTETSIQKNTPRRLRGRVFSVYYILRTAGLAFASSLTGVIAGVIHEEEIVLFTGGLLALYGVISIITAAAGKRQKTGG